MLSYTYTYVAMTKADRTTEQQNDSWREGKTSKWHLTILCRARQVSCLATCWPDV